MRQLAVLAAVAAIIACPVSASAGSTSQRGASEYSPGDRMNDTTGSIRGASKNAPGQEMQQKCGDMPCQRGASEFAPGDRMNDARQHPSK